MPGPPHLDAKKKSGQKPPELRFHARRLFPWPSANPIPPQKTTKSPYTFNRSNRIDKLRRESPKMPLAVVEL